MDFVHKVIISSHTLIILLVVGIAYTFGAMNGKK